MDKKREVTFALHLLTNQIRRLSDSGIPPEKRVTPMQGRIIGFVKRHRGVDVYQRDLEKEFMIRRSTASAILQTMEHNGLIRREPVASDARLKRLMLTQRAEEVSSWFVAGMEHMEAVITKGVERTELDAFFATVAKFEANLREYTAAINGETRDTTDGERKE